MMTEQISDMPRQMAANICVGWKEDMVAQGKWAEIQKNIDGDVRRCPMHQHAVINGRCMCVVGTTIKCRVCGHYMCPDCGSHMVDIMSRVTGYMQIISGWNAAKRQELDDRTRYDLA